MVEKKKAKQKKRTEELVDKEQILPSQKESLDKMIDSPDEENLEVAKEIIKLNTKDALKIGLNEEQAQAFDDILDFLDKPETDAFVLKGYAGTGKTFLVKRIIEFITSTYTSRKIAITAPTNKAVRVLQEDAPFNTDEGKGPVFEDIFNAKSRLNYSTIHKLLGLKEQITNTGEQKFTPDYKDKSELSKYKYLIVDETSMLVDEICREVMKFSKSIRIIYMGDPAQIPPVNRVDCIPFRKQEEYVFKTVELKKIMRQSGEHPVVDASFLIRNNLTIPQPIPVLETNLNDEGKGIVYINNSKEARKAIRPILTKYFDTDEFRKDADYAKVIAWRNKTVGYVNSIIRNILYGEEALAYMVGEKLIANKPIFEEKQDKFWGGGKWSIAINTSEEMEVEDVLVKTKKFTEGSHQLYATIYQCKVKIWDPIDKRMATDHISIIHEDTKKEYNELLRDTKALAVRTRDKSAWVAFYNIMKWSANVGYNYAITAHKAQGSTYGNVILMEEDIDLNRTVLERNRIKYTAYSRPTNRLYILRANY